MQTITIPRQTHPARQHPACRRQKQHPAAAGGDAVGDGPCRLRDVPASGRRGHQPGAAGGCRGRVRRCGADLCTRPADRLCGDIPEHLAGGHAQLGILSRAAALPRRLCAPTAARGCRLGPRPVDIHLAGLAAMGAEVEVEGIAVTLRRRGRCMGWIFTLRLPSVGATLTLLMAACCAAGPNRAARRSAGAGRSAT